MMERLVFAYFPFSLNMQDYLLDRTSSRDKLFNKKANGINIKYISWIQ